MPFIPGLTEPSRPTLPSYVGYGRQAVPQGFYTPAPVAEAMTHPVATLRGLGAVPSTWGYVGIAAALAVTGAGALAIAYAGRKRARRRRRS